MDFKTLAGIKGCNSLLKGAVDGFTISREKRFHCRFIFSQSRI